MCIFFPYFQFLKCYPVKGKVYCHFVTITSTMKALPLVVRQPAPDHRTAPALATSTSTRPSPAPATNPSPSPAPATRPAPSPDHHHHQQPEHHQNQHHHNPPASKIIIFIFVGYVIILFNHYL